MTQIEAIDTMGLGFMSNQAEAHFPPQGVGEQIFEESAKAYCERKHLPPRGTSVRTTAVQLSEGVSSFLISSQHLTLQRL